MVLPVLLEKRGHVWLDREIAKQQECACEGQNHGGSSWPFRELQGHMIIFDPKKVAVKQLFACGRSFIFARVVSCSCSCSCRGGGCCCGLGGAMHGCKQAYHRI